MDSWRKSVENNGFLVEIRKNNGLLVEIREK